VAGVGGWCVCGEETHSLIYSTGLGYEGIGPPVV
jgi:hypothetical protein